jgi:hypothetical protein
MPERARQALAKRWPAPRAAVLALASRRRLVAGSFGEDNKAARGERRGKAAKQREEAKAAWRAPPARGGPERAAWRAREQRRGRSACSRSEAVCKSVAV